MDALIAQAEAGSGVGVVVGEGEEGSAGRDFADQDRAGDAADGQLAEDQRAEWFGGVHEADGVGQGKHDEARGGRVHSRQPEQRAVGAGPILRGHQVFEAHCLPPVG
ncbi:hypothetical protein GZH49_35555 [Nocardia terpenica]|uniref:hypothetical protein n=1 Tax=Nocardia terpenica TaxID=455432 RepID=UPI002FE1591A